MNRIALYRVIVDLEPRRGGGQCIGQDGFDSGPELEKDDRDTTQA